MKILEFSLIIFAIIYLSFETIMFINIPVPEWSTSYLNDFLCMPIVFTICLKAVQYIKNDSFIKLGLPLIFSLTTFYACYFELILPEISDRYTGDLLDVLVYFCGAILFYSLQQLDFYLLNKKATR